MRAISISFARKESSAQSSFRPTRFDSLRSNRHFRFRLRFHFRLWPRSARAGRVRRSPVRLNCSRQLELPSCEFRVGLAIAIAIRVASELGHSNYHFQHVARRADSATGNATRSESSISRSLCARKSNRTEQEMQLQASRLSSRVDFVCSSISGGQIHNVGVAMNLLSARIGADLLRAKPASLVLSRLLAARLARSVRAAHD